MRLYRTKEGFLLEQEQQWYAGGNPLWDDLVSRDDLDQFLKTQIPELREIVGDPATLSHLLLAPIGSQEVWAAGVTYHRSRDARMEEAFSAGGGDFYDRVYQAARPELVPLRRVQPRRPERPRWTRLP